MAEAEVVRTEEERLARRRRLVILLTPVVFFMVAGQIVSFLAPKLIHDHPLVVIAFVPINRWLILAVDKVDPVAFFAVSFVRLLLTDPLFFLLGRWYGDGSLDWIENKTGNSGMVPFVKKWFGRAGPVLVFAMPNTYICLLAGASGMNIALFAGLNITGTIARLAFIRTTADLFEPVLDPIMNFLKTYQWQLVGLSVAIFVVQNIANAKKGKSNDMSVTKMADDLEASIEATEKE